MLDCLLFSRLADKALYYTLLCRALENPVVSHVLDD